MNEPEHVTQQLSKWLEGVDKANIPLDRKRDMVVFLDRVVEVVEQAFRDVLRVCIELKYIRADVSAEDVRGLRKDLDSLRARDKYRDVEFICGKLHVLRDQFHSSGFDTFTKQLGGDFQQLVHLIDDREGAIIDMARHFLGQTEQALGQLENEIRAGRQSSALAEQISNDARDRSASLTAVLDELSGLHARILGSVEVGGLLDVLLQRDEHPRVNVDARQFHMGDYVAGNQQKAGRDIIRAGGDVNKAGRDVVRGTVKDPTSIEDAREMLLAAANKLPAERRAVIGKQLDALIDDIQRNAAPSAIQEKAAALEMMLESGKKLLGKPAAAAWKFLKGRL